MALDLPYLPASAQKLIALIGLPLALRLIDAYGGRTINLYNSEHSQERMATTVGRDAARMLLKFYGNNPFTVPLCNRAVRMTRNAAILATFDRLTMDEKLSGRASVARITAEFAPIHERTIWRILKTTGEVVPVNERQMTLI